MLRWLERWFGHLHPNRRSRSAAKAAAIAGFEWPGSGCFSRSVFGVVNNHTNRDGSPCLDAEPLPLPLIPLEGTEPWMIHLHHAQSNYHQPKRRQRFLVVEDEQDIADLVALHLSDLNADVATVQDGAEGLNRALTESWDAVLLDLRLPNMDGLDICRELRAQASYVPIMMLTSRSTELDRVLGLEIGADDYMVKPFSVAELKARVKALVRRSQQPHNALSAKGEQIQREHLFLDRSRRLARLAEETLDLTAREFDLLWHFASHPGKVFRRSELLDQVWGYGHDGYQHTVNSHINRLRAKIEHNPGEPYFIETIWGIGYRFRDLTH